MLNINQNWSPHNNCNINKEITDDKSEKEINQFDLTTDKSMVNQSEYCALISTQSKATHDKTAAHYSIQLDHPLVCIYSLLLIIVVTFRLF